MKAAYKTIAIQHNLVKAQYLTYGSFNQNAFGPSSKTIKYSLIPRLQTGFNLICVKLDVVGEVQAGSSSDPELHNEHQPRLPTRHPQRAWC